MSKRARSRYRPGMRSPDWVKTKHYRMGRFLIGGWQADDQGRPEALLVGTPTADGALAYAGAVPFSARRVAEEFAGMVTAESPFTDVDKTRRAVYVRPEVEVRVQYQTTTGEGLLRNECIRREPVDP